MIGPIRAVTVSCSDLNKCTQAYETFLGYRTVATERVDDELAELWRAPRQSGSAMVVLQPEGGDECYLRLVESPAVPGYSPILTRGWNAIEIIVADTDSLARKLSESPFSMIGPPEDLSFSDAIRAAQFIGPAGEVLYLTMLKQPVPGFDLPTVTGQVGRPFIVILGGQLDKAKQYYCEQFGLADAPIMDAKISVLSNAYGQPANTVQQLAALALDGQSYIEIDQYPDAAIDRPCLEGFLPPGQCMVTFEADLPENGFRRSDPIYRGTSAQLTLGAAGELIELVRRG